MELKLPNAVTTRADILRLYRELEALERFFGIMASRGDENPIIPKTSKNLDAFTRENNLNLQDAIVRKTLMEFVSFLKDKAPVVHISFASDPSAASVSKIVAWFRDNVDQHVLLRVGVQPSIAGGCIVRTRSRVFDFSFRRHFYDKKEKLIKSIRDTANNALTSPIVAPETVPSQEGGQQ